MEGFPPEFNIDTFKKAIADQTTQHGLAQKELLAKIRQEIYNKVTVGINNGANEVIIELPDTLCREMKLVLATELLERFKGHVYYRWVVEYADCDKFELMETPRVSFDYKIVF